MYNLEQWIEMSAVVMFVIEALKRGLFHNIRSRWFTNKETKAINEDAYALMIQLAAVAVGVVIAFGSEADFLLSIGVDSYHQYAGFIVGGIALSFGSEVIDFAWDMRHFIPKVGSANADA